MVSGHCAPGTLRGRVFFPQVNFFLVSPPAVGKFLATRLVGSSTTKSSPRFRVTESRNRFGLIFVQLIVTWMSSTFPLFLLPLALLVVGYRNLLILVEAVCICLGGLASPYMQ